MNVFAVPATRPSGLGMLAFGAGLVFNAAGIAYIGNKLRKAAREHTQCAST